MTKFVDGKEGTKVKKYRRKRHGEAPKNRKKEKIGAQKWDV